MTTANSLNSQIRPALTSVPAQALAPRWVDELVVNWHVTEGCNFKCRYCYATWEDEGTLREVVRDDTASAQLIQALWQFFRPDNLANPLRTQLRWKHVRLSIAGGEPLLFARQVSRIAQQARALGMRVSLITNGSRLPDDTRELAVLSSSLDMLGLSLDAFDTGRNQAIGRADNKGRTLSLEALAAKLNVARAASPGLMLKINTVVNALNVHEDLRQPLTRLAPDRWKVLRMLPVLGQDLAVTDADFAAFVARHADLPTCMSVEDNQDMLGSYIMVDPLGRFFQNSGSRTGSYFYSPVITADNVSRSFQGMPFAADRFAARYANVPAT